MSLPKTTTTKVGDKTSFFIDGDRLVGEVFPREGYWVGQYWICTFASQGWGGGAIRHNSETEAIESVRRACDEDFCWYSG